MKYADKLKDPRWQQKRLKIMERDEWECKMCCRKNDMLTVHHMLYKNATDPWDYEDHHLVTLCDHCHKLYHELLNNYDIDDIGSVARIYHQHENYVINRG